MKKITAHEQVILDEADAEGRYLASLKEATRNAELLAKSEQASASKRAAAEETAAALRRVEESRQYAEKVGVEVGPGHVHRTFWEWLLNFNRK